MTNTNAIHPILSLTTPAPIRYGDSATAKSVAWFGRQTQGGTSPATNITRLIGGFFASAVWPCSFWAGQAGRLTSRRFLVSGRPTCLDLPFFRLVAKKGGKPFPTTQGVEPMKHPASSPTTVSPFTYSCHRSTSSAPPSIVGHAPTLGRVSRGAILRHETGPQVSTKTTPPAKRVTVNGKLICSLLELHAFICSAFASKGGGCHV